MSSIVVEFQNDIIMQKVISMLEVFRDDGVKIKGISGCLDEKWSDEYIKENWRELIMASDRGDVDDDFETSAQACWEFHNEKYNN